MKPDLSRERLELARWAYFARPPAVTEPSVHALGAGKR
jgi:hypothetical protein